MSLAAKFRKFPVPGYGVCGGADRSCVFEAMDPLDKGFFQHDQDCHKASLIADEALRKKAFEQADHDLHKYLAALTEKDMDQIPVWQWRRPFFKRAYAKAYREACLQIFK